MLALSFRIVLPVILLSCIFAATNVSADKAAKNANITLLNGTKKNVTAYDSKHNILGTAEPGKTAQIPISDDQLWLILDVDDVLLYYAIQDVLKILNNIGVPEFIWLVFGSEEPIVMLVQVVTSLATTVDKLSKALLDF